MELNLGQIGRRRNLSNPSLDSQQNKSYEKKHPVILLATIAVLVPCLPVTTNAATQVYDLNAD